MPRQFVVDGVHTHGVQTPARHVLREAHAVEVYPRPSALQTRRSVMLPQSTAPGAQMRATHTPPEQACIAAQLVVV